MPFLLKKILSYFALPFSLIWELLLLSLLFLWCKRYRAAACTAGVTLVLTLTFSSRLCAHFLLWPLEQQYSPLERAVPSAQWVVVLGGGQYEGGNIPAPSELAPSSLHRLVEGIRQLRLQPQARLLLSGGRVFGHRAIAQTMKDAAIALGVPAERISVESESRDTGDQARAVKAFVRGDAFILVTSAVHMPRAMTLFTGQGLSPIAAPADYLAPRWESFEFSLLLPVVDNILKCDAALHEYLGMVWAKLRPPVSSS